MSKIILIILHNTIILKGLGMQKKNKPNKPYIVYMMGFIQQIGLVFLCMTAQVQTQAQAQTPTTSNQTQGYEAVMQAFSAGNSSLLVQYLDTRVTLSIESKTTTRTRKQVHAYFKDFFSTHPPTNFERVHEGATREQTLYCIARYISSDKTYRIYLHLKARNRTYFIQSISVDSTN